MLVYATCPFNGINRELSNTDSNAENKRLGEMKFY